jgi:hypothetical protein
MSSEIEGAHSKTGCGETVYNRGVSPGMLADPMHERDDRTRLHLGRPTPAEKAQTFDAGKIEFLEKWRAHEKGAKRRRENVRL